MEQSQFQTWKKTNPLFGHCHCAIRKMSRPQVFWFWNNFGAGKSPRFRAKLQSTGHAYEIQKKKENEDWHRRLITFVVVVVRILFSPAKISFLEKKKRLKQFNSHSEIRGIKTTHVSPCHAAMRTCFLRVSAIFYNNNSNKNDYFLSPSSRRRPDSVAYQHTHTWKYVFQ